MKIEDRFFQILIDLYDKSKSNKVNWRVRGDYFVDFGDGVKVEITLFQPNTASDYVVAELSSFGQSLARIHAEDGTANFDLLKGLWDEGYRCTTNWDSVMEKIEGLLKKGNDIGEEDDDIPF